jgi:hypothetical protein
MSAGDSQGLPDPAQPVVPWDTLAEFAGHVVNRLFSVGLDLDGARSLVGDGPAGNRIALATHEVDQLIKDIRTSLFPVAADAREQLMKDQLAQTARSLQATAMGAVAFLEVQAATARQPSRVDYPAEIKRWRSFARRAGQMATDWEQPS